jgi:hypothetical protein
MTLVVTGTCKKISGLVWFHEMERYTMDIVTDETVDVVGGAVLVMVVLT